jgi:hypothetical protein
MAELVRVDCSLITDWPSFHSEFARAFGFPSFYGANNNAWIDCMTRLDEAFSEVQVGTGQIVTLQLDDAGAFKERLPELLTAIFEMAAFVNWRRLEGGSPPILCVSAYA